MKTITITPAPHRRVLHPETNQLVHGTMTVEASSYWLRRLKHGDVVLVEAEKSEVKTKKLMKAGTISAAKEE